MSGYARRKPRSLYKALALPLLMVALGMLILSPTTSFGANKNDSLVYLYPTAGNNPIEANGLFWVEETPQIGSLTLESWRQLLPGKTLAIGAPESHTLGASVLGSAFYRFKQNMANGRKPGQIGENWSKYILEKKDKSKKPPNGGTKIKDILVYERTLPNGVKEKVKVEAGEHFADNDSFDRYIDKIKDKLIMNPEELKEAIKEPANKKSFWDSNSAEITIGGGLVLSGLLSALKVMWPLIFAL